MDISNLLKQAERYAIDNSPSILTAIGVAGTVTTAYLTGKATVKAVDLVRDYEQDRQWPHGMNLSLDPQDAVKMVWKFYIPPVISGGLTVAAIIGANTVSSRRAAALATAFSLSEKAFDEYREKVADKVGEKKERSYRDEIAQDRVKNNPPNDNTVLITDSGDVLCYDHFTGRYFKSNMEALRRAENDVNHLILNQGYASVSDLYEFLGLPVTRYSDEVGWNTDRMLSIVYSTVLSEDGRPCISIDFDLSPHRKYAHFAGE